MTVKGISSLQAKLKRLDPLTKQALVAGVQKAGLQVEGAAKPLARVDTGAMRDSINTKTNVTANGAEAIVGTNIEYAIYHELGTSRITAKPFLQPALQRNKKNARKLIMTEIVKAHRSL